MSRRPLVAAISVCVHALVLGAAMTADLWRPISEWPSPREAMAYIGEVSPPIHLANSEIRPAPSHAPATSPPRSATASPDLAPIAAPDVIAPEDGVVSLGSPAEPREGNQISPFSFGPSVGPVVAPPPPPPVAPQAPIRLHSGIKPPQRVVNVAPSYPSIARSARVQGVVIIEATLDERGSVVRTQLLRSIPLLDAAALDAVRQWKFTPTLLNGIAVPIVMTVTVNFTLEP